MKPLRPSPAVLALLLVLGIFSGCAHKKPVLVMPQQQPPTATPQPTPTPEPTATPATEQRQAEQQPSSTPVEEPKIYTGKTKAKNGQHPAAKKPASPGTDKAGNEVARNKVPKTTVPADKADTTPPAEGQISPGPTPADTHNQAST